MTEVNVTPRRLYLMQVCTSTWQVANQTIVAPLVCYLIQMSDGKNVLVDSGLPRGAQPPAGMSVEYGVNVIEQLAGIGLQPDDINILICTHFDTDHSGYHDAFVKAEHIVQSEQYELARSGHPRFAAARPHWDHPALRYKLVDGDTELLPGVTLLKTSGHTPGHQSVLVSLPQTGPVLLTIDAVPSQNLFTPDRPASPMDDNEEQVQASVRKLLALVEQERVSLVIFGHDLPQWQTLKKAPAWYE